MHLRERVPSIDRPKMRYQAGWIGLVATLWCLCVPLIAQGQMQGIRLDLTLRETLNADTPESEIIDSTSVSGTFDQETTLRVGNLVTYVVAQPVGDNRTRIAYRVYATGPIPGQWGDETVVEFGTPIIIDDIRSKGKSHFRLLLTPHLLSTAPQGMTLPTEDGAWRVVPSAFYHFHLSDQSLALYHFAELRNALEYEFESVRDSLGFIDPGKVDYFFIDGPSLDVPTDARFDYEVDPSRNRVVARHDPLFTGVDVSATLLLKAYRWWGYAPELLAVGIAGYTTFADYHVKQDRRNGEQIDLKNCLRSIDFKRQPFPASLHHAASFVKWLIHYHGIDDFREAYGKSTDLSLERALFSVYDKTLEELESEWLSYLDGRSFTANEYYGYSKRAAAYHHYEEHYELIKLAAAMQPPKHSALRELTLAAAQLGRWPEAVDFAYQMAENNPADPKALSLLAEVQWAVGDIDGCRYHMLQVARLDSTDARPYILLGDLQMAERRADSAATLWEYGLTKAVERDPAAFELLIRIGRHLRSKRNRDSANVFFGYAHTLAQSLIPNMPGDVRPITRMGEVLMEIDSLDSALKFLESAAYIADAPQEMGRVYLNIGRCHDLAGRRRLALSAYETVFQIPATFYHERLARRYVNTIYTH